jgi:hypothetical protein
MVRTLADAGEEVDGGGDRLATAATCADSTL